VMITNVTSIDVLYLFRMLDNKFDPSLDDKINENQPKHDINSHECSFIIQIDMI
jgi:hypothetical protein